MPSNSSTRSKSNKSSEKGSPNKSNLPSKRSRTSTSKKTDVTSEDEETSIPENESDEEFDSDNLDESDSEKKKNKRKRASTGKSSSPKKAKTNNSRSPKKKANDDGSDYDDIEDGQEVVGKIIQAPTTGRVPPGQISKNTLNFLRDLKDPEKNDRTWFKLHEPVYRQAEQEWKDFIENFTTVISKADPQIPYLPPKDVIHRIYRDVRFSNDKTPYKGNLSASFSRSGRKGIFAGYHVSIKPGDSMLAAGTWCPGRNELACIRHNIMHDSSRLRQIIESKDFVKIFGVAKPGERRNVFGMDDELKVAPKGVDKTHPDIDLLKLRSVCVSCRFLDSEVLAPDFKDRLGKIIQVLRPFVHCINDMMTISPPDLEGSDEE